MMTNENGNVVAVGYFVGISNKEQINSYRMTIKFSKNETKNDYLYGNVCVQTVTMPKGTLGAEEVYLEDFMRLKDQLIAIEFKHNGNNYWAPVSVKVVDENDPEELKKVTAKDARFMMDQSNSEKEKFTMTWCQFRAEHGEAYKASERVIPSENIKGNCVTRKYGIETKLVENGNNFNYYLEKENRIPVRHARVCKH